MQKSQSWQPKSGMFPDYRTAFKVIGICLIPVAIPVILYLLL